MQISQGNLIIISYSIFLNELISPKLELTSKFQFWACITVSIYMVYQWAVPINFDSQNIHLRIVPRQNLSFKKAKINGLEKSALKNFLDRRRRE